MRTNSCVFVLILVLTGFFNLEAQNAPANNPKDSLLWSAFSE
jgi:hypothetical protein